MVEKWSLQALENSLELALNGVFVSSWAFPFRLVFFGLFVLNVNIGSYSSFVCLLFFSRQMT